MHDRDQILERTDLAGLADEILGPHHGPDRSPTWPCPNPNHAQTGRTPPVTIFDGHAGFERWHCHGCGAGGTAIDLVMAVRGIDVRDALEALATRSGLRNMTVPETPDHRCSRRRPPRTVTDPSGLAAYIDDCSARLWTDDGARVRRWLTEARGIPEDVLRVSRIGADPGSWQDRPTGMPTVGWAAVLPVLRDGEPVFAQLRSLGTGRLRYLNASSDLAPNPRVALYQPYEQRGSCIVVTEGVLDALSAAAAGFRSVALLGASVPDPSRPSGVAAELRDRLTDLDGRLVLALDNDDAGRRGSDRLLALLGDRPDTVRVAPPTAVKDLNGWMRSVGDEWPAVLSDSMRTAIDITRTPSLGR